MVQQNIVSYIETQLQQGKRLEEINSFLLQAGYEKSEVESSIQYVINIQTNPKLAEEQRIQQLSRYIQDQLKTGYPSQVIANFLISKGYPYYEVNSALQQATMPRRELKVEHKFLALAAIFILIAAAGIVVMYFKAYTLIGIGMPESLLDVEANKLTTIVQQGGEITFQVKLINLGYQKRFDVLLTYSIIERDTQAVVLEKTETVGLSTTLENIVKFEIPDTIKAGKYVLKVVASYQDYNATSGFVFDILPKELAKEQIEEIRKQVPVIPENITEIPELAPQNITAPEAKPVITPTPTPIPAPGEKKFYEGLTKTEAFEQVKQVSVREPQKAIDMCKELTVPQNKEECINTIAKYKRDAVYCKFLDAAKQDMCVFNLVIETKQYTFCSQINETAMRNSCTMMGKASAVGQNPQGAADAFSGFNLEVTPVPTPKMPTMPQFG